MAHTPTITEERPVLGRPIKYGFFQTLRVGAKEVISIEGMSTQERWRKLRSLRSIATRNSQEVGRRFEAKFVGNTIEITRLA